MRSLRHSGVPDPVEPGPGPADVPTLGTTFRPNPGALGRKLVTARVLGEPWKLCHLGSYTPSIPALNPGIGGSFGIVFTREEVAALHRTIAKTALGRKFVLGQRYKGTVTPQEAREAVLVIERAGKQAGSAKAFLGRFKRLAGL